MEIYRNDHPSARDSVNSLQARYISALRPSWVVQQGQCRGCHGVSGGEVQVARAANLYFHYVDACVVFHDDIGHGEAVLLEPIGDEG